MKQTDRDRLRQAQRLLKTGSFEHYTRIVRHLLREHRHYSFLKPLSDSFRMKDWDSVVNLAGFLSEQKYSDATSHFVANQFALLIKKYPWPKDLVSFDPRATAKRTFELSELRCKRISRKHDLLSIDRSRDRFSKEIGMMRRWIRNLIGSRPNYRHILSKCDFGPGAALGVHGDATNILAKLTAETWSVSPGALHHGYAALRKNHQLWEALLPRRGDFVCYDEEAAFAAYLSSIRVARYNKISFVPKTAKTERTIAVEPLLNGFVQKGIDLELRSRLLSIGIDLSDQGLNQEMARLGSLDDSDDGFVTIDLKSASDSVSIGVVRRLLPSDWFDLLDRTRSHYYLLDNVERRYEKFCSMGNGFCFPLETLIFAAACAAVGSGVPAVDFMVYGDDIIVRKRHSARLIALLKHIGFKINTEKTFLEGPFRESCGKDWFGGQDVRPFTLDYDLDCLQSCFKFLNLSRKFKRSESFFATVRSLIIDRIPLQYRFFRPFAGNEDTGIDSTGDEHLTTDTCWFLPRGQRWEWRELSFDPILDRESYQRKGHEIYLMSVALRGSQSMDFGPYKGSPEVTLRRRVQTKVVRKSYVATSNWLPPLQPGL